MTPATRTEPLEVLLLGGTGTAMTSNGSLRSLQSANITLAGNRADALAVLRKQGRHAAARRPALILLDLAAYGEQGWTVLRKVKGDQHLMRIPIIVLGAANSGEERARAYDLHANCYLPRLEDEQRAAFLLERIDDFWLARVRLPGE